MYINKSKPIVIWVTWSVGKTSCRMIIYQTLKIIIDKHNIYTSPKNFNWEIGTALSIFQIEKFGPNPWLFLKILAIMIWKVIFDKPWYDIIFIEYWIDHIWEMDLQLGIIKPDFAIWTGVDMVHASNYPNNDPSYIASEKAKLALAARKMVFLNKNDSYCRDYIDKIWTDLFLFDTSDGSIDKASKIQINSTMTWSHNIAYINIWTVIAETLRYQLWYKDNKQYIYDIDYDLQAGRYTILNGVNNSNIIDSSYNWAPASMKVTIKQVVDGFNISKNSKSVKSENISNIYKKQKIILVLGEMRELGNLSQSEHENLIQYICDLKIENLDKLVLVSGDMIKYGSVKAKKLSLDYINYEDSLTAGKRLRDYILANEDVKYTILFKSSQWQIYLEEAIKCILADMADVSKLCRQDNEWIKIKKKQGRYNS